MSAEQEKESTWTVLIAGGANLTIAAAKAVGGILSGSSAMLSEAAHSVADTVTEVLLFTSLKRASKPADEEHPLGYGNERYIWALLASVATFVGGAVFSFYDGIEALRHSEELGSPFVSYLVLAVAFVIEGVSLIRGMRQSRQEAASIELPTVRYLQHTPDTAVKAVVVEDSVALVGLVLAAGGLLGAQLTGSSAWDGVASLLIGALLTWAAFVLGRSNAELLIGRALPQRWQDAMREVLLDSPRIRGVLELVTVVQGPDEVLLAAKVDFVDGASAEEIEWTCEDAETRLRDRFPAVGHVFLDPTPGPGDSRPRGDAR
jgi:cation diffusion facilitator family transporter